MHISQRSKHILAFSGLIFVLTGVALTAYSMFAPAKTVSRPTVAAPQVQNTAPVASIPWDNQSLEENFADLKAQTSQARNFFIQEYLGKYVNEQMLKDFVLVNASGFHISTGLLGLSNATISPATLQLIKYKGESWINYTENNRYPETPQSGLYLTGEHNNEPIIVHLTSRYFGNDLAVAGDSSHDPWCTGTNDDKSLRKIAHAFTNFYQAYNDAQKGDVLVNLCDLIKTRESNGLEIFTIEPAALRKRFVGTTLFIPNEQAILIQTKEYADSLNLVVVSLQPGGRYDMVPTDASVDKITTAIGSDIINSDIDYCSVFGCYGGSY